MFYRRPLPHLWDAEQVVFLTWRLHDSLPPNRPFTAGRVQKQFVTAVYAFIDAGQRSIVYASAGHPPLLLQRAANNAIEPLKQGGLVLGPFRKRAYANSRVEFARRSPPVVP